LGREKVILKDQVLEVRKSRGGCTSLEKSRHDEWDPPIPVYDAYGLSDSHDFDVIT
jgi:hypothetical protein